MPPEAPKRFVGELTPELLFDVGFGNPLALASVNERMPSLGSDAPVKVIVSPEPVNVKVMFVALGLKNGSVTAVEL